MNKLVLFDIDGTLIHGTKKYIEYWQQRVTLSIQDAFGVTPVNPDPMIFNGFVDRNLFWHLVRDTGVSRERFDTVFPYAARIFHRRTREHHAKGHVSWQSIPSAIRLVKKLKSQDHIMFGLITGNIEANGWFKLEIAGIKHLFDFGAFADSVDDRLSLATLALTTAQKYFRKKFSGRDIFVIGDTKHDVRAGKHIDATTIAVLTGPTETEETLSAEHPDLLVDSLMDERVFTLLGL